MGSASAAPILEARLAWTGGGCYESGLSARAQGLGSFGATIEGAVRVSRGFPDKAAGFQKFTDTARAAS